MLFVHSSNHSPPPLIPPAGGEFININSISTTMAQQYIKNIIHTDQQIKSMLQLIPNNYPVCYEDLKEIFKEEKQ